MRCLLLVALLLFSTRVAFAEEIWDGPPLSADPQAVVDALAKHPRPDDADVQILLDEMTYTVDSQRRIHYEHRRIYRCLTRAGARDWAFVSAAWRDWYEERPTIKARVITAKAKAFALDQESIAEVSGDNANNQILRDQKGLRAPLPAMGPDCIVEAIVSGTQKKPFFAAGQLKSQFFFSYTPMDVQRLIVKAPRDVPLKFGVRGLELKPDVSEADGTTQFVYEYRHAPEPPKYEAFLPSDQPFIPHIDFATGKSWAKIAQQYSKAIEKVIEKEVDTKEVESLAKAAAAGAETDPEKIQRILSQMQHLIRYTGIEFGESAIIPYTPKTTLSRRYGDCKDQSLLLVSMLKAVGIEAHLALLRTGYGEDLNPDLPGLNAFNHVIVHVPGKESLWIDPTHPFVPAGELPLVDQGRYALIANPDTVKLVRTPHSKSSDNVQQDLREYTLRQWDPTDVVHKVHSTGFFAADRRAYYAEQNVQQQRTAWEDYGERAYGTREISKYEGSDPFDTQQSWKSRVQYQGAVVAVIDPLRAIMRIDPSGIFDNLPVPLFEPAEAPRTHPVALRAPYVAVERYHITPPAGFVPIELPEAFDKQIGGTSVSMEVQAKDDHSLVLEFRLDTGNELISADDVKRFRKMLHDLRNTNDEFGYGWLVTVQFENTARKLLEQGKVKEALASYQLLIHAHPDDHLHRLQFAEGLLAAGFGIAARQQVELVVKHHPEHAAAWEQLGLARTYDLLGRQFQPGMDWQGAAEAFEKAMELAPKNVNVRWNYAILHEHNKAGHRYASDADIAKAVELYEECLEQTPNDAGLIEGMLMALMYSEDFETLRDKCEAFPSFLTRDRLLLVAVAATDGMDQAMRLARRIYADDDQRIDAMLNVGDLLIWSRQYQLGADIIERNSRGHARERALRTLVSGLRKCERFDSAKFEPDDPCHVVHVLLSILAQSQDWSKDASHLFIKGTSDESLEQEFNRVSILSNGVLKSFRAAGRTPQWCADWLAHADLTADETAPEFWLVTARIGGMYANFFVVAEDDVLRLVPYRADHAPLGELSLRLVDDDPERATKLLEFAFDSRHKEGIAYLNSFSGTSFGRLWKWREADDIEQVKLAAAALNARNPQPDTSVKLLEKYREQDIPSWQKLQIDRALCDAYANARSKKFSAHAEKMAKSNPKRPEFRFYQARALVDEGKWDELADHAEKMLTDFKDDEEVAGAAARWLADAGRFDRARELLNAELENENSRSSIIHSDSALIELFRDDPDHDAAIALGQRANQLSNYGGAFSLQTLASVYADAGRAAEAHSHMLLAVSQRRDNNMDDDDWYVLGRMAEHYGMPELAADCFTRVEKSKILLGRDVWHLAQRRLKNLEADQAEK